MIPRGEDARRRETLALALALGLTSPLGLACSGEGGERRPAVERAPEPTPTALPHQDPFAEQDLEALRPRPRLSWPTVIPHITSTFGWRTNPITGAGSKLHRGLDLRGQTGDPVLTVGDGTIRFAGHDPFLGTCVIVDHGGGLTSWYGHLSDLLVYEGMVVERGAAIGLVGTTGRSQAPHLHLSIKIGETSVDPLLVLGAPAYAYPALLGPPEEAPPAPSGAS